MISFPNAKINLGLHVLNKREDGFHNIESCFLPIGWKDILEIVESKSEKFTFTGIPIPGPHSDNLCLKAYKILRERYAIPPIHLHLHKTIPLGGGLGGGSSDGAFTLKILNDLFEIGIEQSSLEKIATDLGSDCPFFIRNTPAMAAEKGDLLREISLDLRGKKIMLVNPGIHISTPEAYGGIKVGTTESGALKKWLSNPIDHWKATISNDFETYVFQKHPEVQRIKEILYQKGALYASMTGSGATVYGIFEPEVPKIEFPRRYIQWSGDL